MLRRAITDEHWEILEPFFGRRLGKSGRKPKAPRDFLEGVLWVMRTGAPWRDIPTEFGDWNAIYKAFGKWRDSGTFAQAQRHIVQLVCELERPEDAVLWFVDSTILRASKAAAGAEKKPVDRATE